MFPVCQRCGGEYLDPSCGGWQPNTPPHDCIESLEQQERLAQRQLTRIQSLLHTLKPK